MMDRLSKAFSFATAAHEGQLRADGHPYIVHPFRVYLSLAGFDDDHLITALLHDVLEDTDVFPCDINDEFGPDVLAAVDAMTRTKDESYEDAISRAMANPIARTVKIMDIRDNLSDLPDAPFTEERKMKLFKRYSVALARLNNATYSPSS